MSLVLLASILASLVPLRPALQGAGKNPVELDRTGVPWAKSFEEALERARGEVRLLFVMPDNGAPSDSGSWSHECFRAGPLSDERIAALLQARFVPFYFNTFRETPAFDERALAFVVRVNEEFGKEEQSFDGGMPVLFMAREGELVGEVGPYMSCDEVLTQMLRILKKNSRFDAPSAAEKAVTEPLERARHLFARQDLDGAESVLKKLSSSEALVLRAKVARLAREWKRHAKLLDELQKAGLEDDHMVERAWNCLADGEVERACKAAGKVGASGARSDEARYLEGVAYFRLGRREKGGSWNERALGIWKTLIQTRPQGPWIYRADWAYVNALSGDAGAISGDYDGACPSLLGRAFYAGPKNPDLGL